MQRPVDVEGQEIRDIDQCRNRPQPDRVEPLAQPARARPVFEAADMAAEKQRTGFAVLDMDRDRRAEAALDGRRVERVQPPHAGRREIAGDAAHAEAIGAVRRHLDVENRIVETDEARIRGADRRVGRQFDDPGMILAEAPARRPTSACRVRRRRGLSIPEAASRSSGSSRRPDRTRPSCRCGRWVRRTPLAPHPSQRRRGRRAADRHWDAARPRRHGRRQSPSAMRRGLPRSRPRGRAWSADRPMPRAALRSRDAL